MPPLISFITPMHNAASTIEAAYRSLCALRSGGDRLDAWEWLVVNDRSTDGSPQQVAAFAESDTRVRLMEARGRGVSAARNTGIGRASGEWLMFLDADDWVLPDGPSRLIRAAEPTGAAFGSTRLVNHDGADTGWVNRAGVARADLDMMLESNRFQPCAMAVRRSVLGPDRFLDRAVEDYDLWLQMAHRGVTWAGIRDEVAAYRLSPGGQSRKFDETAVGHRMLLEDAFRRGRDEEWPPGSSGSVVDWSIERERGLIARRLYECATSCATQPQSHGGSAGELYLRSLGDHAPPPLPASFAGWSAFWHVPHGLSVSPHVWTEAGDDWLRQTAALLDAWWRESWNRGWISGERPIEEARDALASLIAGHARGVVDAMPSDGRVVLLGLGQNAAAIAAEFGRTYPGRPIGGRDHRHAPGRLELAGVSIDVEDPDGPFDPAACHVMTPTDDQSFLERIPQDVPLVRYRDIASAVGDKERARLERAWPVPAVPA